MPCPIFLQKDVREVVLAGGEHIPAHLLQQFLHKSQVSYEGAHMAQMTPQAHFSGPPGSWKAWKTPVTTPTTFTFPIACPTPQQRLQQPDHGNRLGQMLKEYRGYTLLHLL